MQVNFALHHTNEGKAKYEATLIRLSSNKPQVFHIATVQTDINRCRRVTDKQAVQVNGLFFIALRWLGSALIAYLRYIWGRSRAGTLQNFGDRHCARAS